MSNSKRINEQTQPSRSGGTRHVTPTEPDGTIPVLRTLLPTCDRLLPYLRRIDAARTYSNWGRLTGELERRVGDHFDLPPGCVVSASSGTGALIGAILAAAGRAVAKGRIRALPLTAETL